MKFYHLTPAGRERLTLEESRWKHALLASPIIDQGRRMKIGIRGDQDAVSFTSTVRSIVAEPDPVLALSDVQTIEQPERSRDQLHPEGSTVG